MRVIGFEIASLTIEAGSHGNAEIYLTARKPEVSPAR
jgi:hypothetical protein